MVIKVVRQHSQKGASGNKGARNSGRTAKRVRPLLQSTSRSTGKGIQVKRWYRLKSERKYRAGEKEVQATCPQGATGQKEIQAQVRHHKVNSVRGIQALQVQQVHKCNSVKYSPQGKTAKKVQKKSR